MDPYSGWIFNSDNPSKISRVGIYENGQLLGETLADQYRADLEAAGVVDGPCAFNMLLQRAYETVF